MMKLVMKFSPLLCYLVPLRPKYSLYLPGNIPDNHSVTGSVDLPSCSAVPQLTALPHGRQKNAH
jgi:hypothetical protein